MPPLSFWFAGSAMGAFIAVVVSAIALCGSGFAWYRAAKTEQQSVEKKATDEQNKSAAGHAAILQKLTAEYIASHDGISARMMAGLEYPPKEWINKRLEEMGGNWRLP